jgi:hypothetical protein
MHAWAIYANEMLYIPDKNLNCKPNNVMMQKTAIGFLHNSIRGSKRFALLQYMFQIASRRCQACRLIWSVIDKEYGNVK